MRNGVLFPGVSLPITAARPADAARDRSRAARSGAPRVRGRPARRRRRGHSPRPLLDRHDRDARARSARPRRRAPRARRPRARHRRAHRRRRTATCVATVSDAGRAAAARSRRIRRSSRCIARCASAPPSWRRSAACPARPSSRCSQQITEPGRLADLVAGYLDVARRRAPGAARDARGRGPPAPRADPRPAPDRGAVRPGGHPVEGQGGARRPPARGLPARAAAARSRRSSARATRRPTRRSKELKAKLDKLPLPDEARKEVDREWSRLTRVGRESMESQVIRTYLETIAELPWGTRTEEHLDVAEAARILDEDHYGLGDVKDRVLEFLAVHQLSRRRSDGEQGPHPAVRRVRPASARRRSRSRSLARWAASTSASRSAARATRPTSAATGARTSARCRAASSQGMKQAGSKNPVFLLDEVDKLGVSYQGDPASALLEVLDPAQNDSFTDHYLGVPFDLSEVMFIATANFIQNIPGPLLDRMEVVDFAGYTEREKLADREALPRAAPARGERARRRAAHADRRRDPRGDHAATRAKPACASSSASSAGSPARSRAGSPRRRSSTSTLDRRRRAPAARPAARPPREGGARGPGRHRDRHVLHAGRRRHHVRRGRADARQGRPDPHRPARRRDEGVGARRVDVRAVARRLARRSTTRVFERDVHVHVPAGAIPKDGPSAGIAMATAMVSALSGRPARHDVAMTGEITLSGRVLPIGGLKEKVLGAVRAGITHIVIPRDNEADLDDLPADVLETLDGDAGRHARRGARDHAARHDAARRPPAVRGRPPRGERADALK